MKIKNTFNNEGRTLDETLSDLIAIYAYDLLENK